MTGTAMTEEAEFNDIYGLCAVEIPTNRPVQRQDEHDVIYRTEKEKYKAIIDIDFGMPPKRPADSGGYNFNRKI